MTRSSPTIRAYTPDDQPALLALLRRNTPRFFHVSEEQEYRTYLERHREEYFVVEADGAIVGAGGLNYFPDEQLARLSWDVVDPERHGQGIGHLLTSYRLERLRQRPEIRQVVVRTTQEVYRFYEKMGFTLVRTEHDFWAPGFDLYQMQRAL
ncbi:N-acetylglutamate synthase, GNAT family [Catalinimonas alkaloidigena]|uniref:N-acetylglutamate synthase, GNAT family n=1 Tax=Catalinimonas alkaloidigena TaxID=1075417 RepID=A0A1G9ADE6_9BACT|nr:GNAT family N-acetyltransferase [Catalinimonas alkaloidigena]SDK25288.1 N-acetylglutamate synthase, GNAT family [Catalinimonas alkaloidigena]